MKQFFTGLFAAVLLGLVSPALAEVANPEATLAQITKRDERIVAYFDQAGKRVKSPAPKGFYRKLYGKTAQGHHVVQDFYQATNTKLTDPSIIISPKGLTSVSVDNYLNLPIQKNEYYASGAKISTVRLAKDSSIVGQVFYPSGKVDVDIEMGANEETMRMTQYYEDGSKMTYMEMDKKQGTGVLQAWHPNGRQAIETNMQKQIAQGWDEQGKPLSLEQSHLLVRQFMGKFEQAMSIRYRGQE